MRTTAWRIYIPLCFYFIIGSQKLHPHGLKFTFHYASTLSHKKDISQEIKIPDLHSIMLLLYRRERWRRREAGRFTFHYASTLSETDLCIYFLILYLHSIMLLLYRRQKKYSSWLWNLHSIMLLLYPVSFFSPYFLLFRPIFCPPSFLFIFSLQKHPCQISKMQFYLGSSSFVYLLEILHYFKSTITESCSFYHHPHPRTL